MSIEGFFGGKQDPYAVLKVGDGSVWKYKTEVREDGGSYALFRPHFSQSISASDILSGRFTIKALDKDDSKDKNIGKADIDLTDIVSSPIRWVDFKGDLLEKEKSTVSYIVRVRFRTEEIPEQPRLEIKEITLTDLANTGKRFHFYTSPIHDH